MLSPPIILQSLYNQISQSVLPLFSPLLLALCSLLEFAVWEIGLTWQGQEEIIFALGLVQGDWAFARLSISFFSYYILYYHLLL